MALVMLYPKSVKICREHIRMASPRGRFATSPVFSRPRNTGVSSTLERIYSPIRPSGAASRNGIRQPPQAWRSSVLNVAVIAAPSNAPATEARPTVAGMMLAYVARLPSGAYSTMNAEDPPCTRRRL